MGIAWMMRIRLVPTVYVAVYMMENIALLAASAPPPPPILKFLIYLMLGIQYETTYETISGVLGLFS